MFDADALAKARRFVQKNNGEVLFARCVVLYEGDTEDGSLPTFAAGLAGDRMPPHTAFRSSMLKVQETSNTSWRYSTHWGFHGWCLSMATKRESMQ